MNHSHPSSDDLEPFILPPGIRDAYTTKEAARILHADERRIMRLCRGGFIKGVQTGGKGGKFWISPLQIVIYARRFMREPDWEAAEVD